MPIDQEGQRYTHYNAQYYAVCGHAHKMRVIERVDFDLTRDPRDEAANHQHENFVTKQNVQPRGIVFGSTALLLWNDP